MNPPRRTLAGHLDDYLTLRRALGCKLIRAERDLRQFLDYLGERELDTLTVEAAVALWGPSLRVGRVADFRECQQARPGGRPGLLR